MSTESIDAAPLDHAATAAELDQRGTALVIGAGAFRGRPHEMFSAVRGMGRELWQDKAGFAGLVILVLLVLMAVFAPWLAPYDPSKGDLLAKLTPPAWLEGGSWDHPLGTDHIGYDVLSRLIYGARVSLMVGVGVVALAGSFGVLMGLIAGYRGGRVDAFIMRWIDTQIAFPGLLLALMILAVVGASMTTVIIVLAINGWMVYGRMTRGIVLSVRQLPYVEAAEMVGCSGPRVVFRHILPNLTSPLLTLGILEFARIILAEAALSFLGLGVQFPETSWGLDVARGETLMAVAWWPITIPGVAIAVTVLAVNMLASWARITSDPQEREKRFARQIAAREKHLERRARRAAARPAGAGA